MKRKVLIYELKTTTKISSNFNFDEQINKTFAENNINQKMINVV